MGSDESYEYDESDSGQTDYCDTYGVEISSCECDAGYVERSIRNLTD